MTDRSSICMLTFSPMLFDARIQKEAKALYEAGYKVTILYVEDQQMLDGVPNLAQAQKSYAADMNGIYSKPLFLKTRKWRFFPKPIHHLLQAVELFVKFFFNILLLRAQYYHSHDLKPAIFAWFGCVLHNGKLIYDAHEIEVTTGGPNLIKLFKAYERFIMQRAALALTVNEEISELMSKSYNKNVQIIANRPLFVSNSKIDVGRLRKEVPLNSNDEVLMYVGYVTPYTRGLEVVIQSLAHLDKNIIFLIMGVGRLNEFKDHLNNFIKQKKLENIKDRIRFIGPFPPDEIIHYLHGASISMLLYQQGSDNNASNAPNKLYQSIMARTPILASYNTTFPKFIYNNDFGPIGETVDASDELKVAKVIRNMLDEKNQLIYRNNCELMAAEISWEVEKQKLQAYYKIID